MGKGVRIVMMSKANELLQELSSKIIASNQGKIRFTATEAYALVERIHDEIADIRPTEMTMEMKKWTIKD